jgi:hypothetical protein
LRRKLAAGLGIAAVVAAVPALGAAAPSQVSPAPKLALRWTAPTPANGKLYTVEVGTPLSVPVAATPGTVISARGLPAGASLTRRTDGVTLTWTPTAATVGPHAVVLAARKPGTLLYTPPRTLFLHGVPAATAATAGATTTLLSSPRLSRWAYVARRAVARAAPSTSARIVTRLATRTLDETPNLVLVLASTRDAIGRTWFRVRLPILPNNSTGWVLAGALGQLHAVTTYLVVDRLLLTATLYRSGAPIFQTRVGAGRPYWPTPRGDFYVREVLTGFTDPLYGPVAFGTSARSAVLTDWNGGGGVIGIHGTDHPEILPGRVSHGCVRMPNASIRRLHRLMPLGTPVAIR